MCGIIGLFGIKDASKLAKQGLKLIKNRGRDGCGLSNGKISTYAREPKNLKNLSGNILGHNLHAIIGEVKQPLENRFVINCEIYNWKELGFQGANDAEAVLKLIEKEGVIEGIKKLDGVYAFAYRKGKKVYLCRDIIGVKPLWYSNEKGFAFASEKKVLIELGYKEIFELNPRTILIYDGKINKLTRKYFNLKPLIKSKEKEIIKRLEGLVVNAVAKRIPDRQFGILFSGGVDSALIALVCKQLGLRPVLYTAALEEKGMEEARDLYYAKKVAKELGLKLKVARLNLKDVEKDLKKVVPLIEDNNVTKVGVALTFYAACKLAKKDGIKVIFSGLGSEEIFAGYERHKNSSDVNKECLSGLIKIYERDLYRDDVITMDNKIEIRLPLLDLDLIKYGLRIPPKFKLNKDGNKMIFRKVSEKLGLNKEFAYRKKMAAQYGSKFHRSLSKLTRKNGFDRISDYLKTFYVEPNVKLALLCSSGKDSWLSAYRMVQQNYEISCLVSLKSMNKDSFMFHTPNIDLVEMQSKTSNLPLILQKTKGEKELELKDMERALSKAIKEYGIRGIVMGAVFSNYQRSRVEDVCEKLGLKIFAPLWHMDQEKLLQELVKEKFEVIVSSVAADGLDESWLGRKLDEKMIKDLNKLNHKIGLNVAGEGGEFESLVLNCPLFSKKIKVISASKHMEGECRGFYIVEKAKLTTL